MTFSDTPSITLETKMTYPKMTKRHARRLLKLATFLRGLKRRQVDMGIWMHKLCDAKDHECGTAACAMGWAGTIPEFKRAGLVSKLTLDGVGRGSVEFSPGQTRDVAHCEELDNYVGLSSEKGDGGCYYGVEAGRRFFGLTYGEAVELFAPDVSMTPAEVAKAIRKVVKKHHPQVYRQDLMRRMAAAR